MGEVAVLESKITSVESNGSPHVGSNGDAEKGHSAEKPELLSSLGDLHLVRARLCNFSNRFTLLTPMNRLHGTGLMILLIPKIGLIEGNGQSLSSSLPTHAFRLCQAPSSPLL